MDGATTASDGPGSWSDVTSAGARDRRAETWFMSGLESPPTAHGMEKGGFHAEKGGDG